MVELLQGAGFLGMALARTLLELFVARLVLGFMGASSTFAFMLAGRERDPGEVRRQVALVQTAMMVGGVIGPLAGAVTAARIGFRPSFVIGALILAGCAALVAWGVKVPAAGETARASERRLRVVDVVAAVSIVLAGSVHLFFLAPVLPQVLPGLGVGEADLLEVGGVVIFASSAAAALGGLGAPHVAPAGLRAAGGGGAPGRPPRCCWPRWGRPARCGRSRPCGSSRCSASRRSFRSWWRGWPSTPAVTSSAS